MAEKQRIAEVPSWNGTDYAHVKAGRYKAIAVRIQGPEWVHQYSRWSILIEFELLGEDQSVRVPVFFNLGSNKETTHVGRQSRYFKAWTIANGELPRRGQKMLAEVFLEGQIFEIEIEDIIKDSENGKKTDAEIYSRVKTVISADRKMPAHHESISQESLNQES